MSQHFTLENIIDVGTEGGTAPSGTLNSAEVSYLFIIKGRHGNYLHDEIVQTSVEWQLHVTPFQQ